MRATDQRINEKNDWWVMTNQKTREREMIGARDER